HDVLAEAILEWGRRRDLLAERLGAKRRQRRLLALAVAAVILAAVMAGVTAYALSQRSQARGQTRHARAAALAAGALAEMPDDPGLGLLLAREAAAYDRTPAIENVLRSALLASRARAVLRGQSGEVLAAGFTSGRVATVDGEGTLREFPPRTSRPVSARPLGGRVRAAAFAADGTAVAVARRRLVEVHVLGGTGRGFAFRDSSPVRAIAIDAHGDRIAVASIDGRVTVHAGAGVVFTARTVFGPTSLALGPDGRTLAAAGGGQLAVWRTDSRRPTALIQTGADVTGVAVAPGGALVATAGADAAVRLWRVPAGRLAGIALATSPLTGVAFSPDGKALVAGSTNGSARVFDARDGHVISVLARHADAVTTAAFSPDGRLLVTGSKDETARIWNPGVAPELRLVARPPGCCTAFADGPGGALVASGNRALRYVNGHVAAVYPQPAPVSAVAVAGSAVVTGGADGRVRLWRSTGAPSFTLTVGAAVTAVAAGPSTLVAAGADGRVLVWSAGGRELLAFRERRPVAGVAVSHDGRLLATAGTDSVARIRELPSGRLVHELSGHTKPLTAVAFSPDGSRLATSSFDHDVRLWDVATGRLVHLLRAHFAVVSGVAFSPDGRWLVTAGPTTAGLWQADSGAFVAYLRGHAARLVGAAFTTDGRSVVSASVDGTIRSYRCDICGGIDDLLRLADRRLAATGSTLTAAERRRYVLP
ncbi:MAG: WD40 domain-containing protein, partial [Gaiellaceae bacterium]